MVESIRNGVKLWEYILGRGNSFLEYDQMTYLLVIIGLKKVFKTYNFSAKILMLN